MEKIFNFIWAGLTAWVMVWFLMKLNTWFGWAEWLFIPSLIGFFASHGVSAKVIAFFILFFLNWSTDLHHKIAGVVLAIIFGIFCLIAAILAVYYGWEFLSWLASTL